MFKLLPQNARPAQDTFICEINAEIALDWLTRNQNNRNLKTAAAKKLSKSIALDQWKCNHQPIAFDWNGRLIDGQHRLWAISKNDKTVSVRVTVNCEPETIKTVDVGTVRSNADMLTLSGHKNSRKLASFLRQYLAYKHYPSTAWNNQDVAFSAITIEKELSTLSEKFDINNIITFTKNCSNKNKDLVQTSSSTFYVLGLEAGYDAGTIEDYLDLVSTGLMLQADDVVYKLRQRWANAKLEDYVHSIKSQKKLNELIHCFNMHVSGKKLKVWREVQSFPVLTINENVNWTR